MPPVVAGLNRAITVATGLNAQWDQLYRRMGKWLDGGAFMHAGDANAAAGLGGVWRPLPRLSRARNVPRWSHMPRALLSRLLERRYIFVPMAICEGVTMMLWDRARFALPALLASIATFAFAASAQEYPKQTQLPNPYRLEENWPTLPKDMNGGKWGELIRADIDPKGNIWVFHRCFNTEPAGAATCVGRSEPPILEFDPSGKLLTSFGGGMFAFPHGFTVDAEGNVWASDANARETVLGLSAKGPNGITRGHQVFKFSPTGAVLMTLGKQGVKGSGPDTFDQPTGIAIAPNGDIFVTDGHGKNDRVLKFSKDGRFIKSWGHHGTGPGEFDQPHDISIGGSQGRVFIADRSNNRVQIFDQDGNFIAAWKQFGRPSAVFVSKDDTLYVSDSHSNSTVNPGYTRGITIWSAKDGSLRAFIPDPDLAQADVNRISGASGIVADDQGTIYAADVGPHKLRKYVKVK